MHNCSGTVKVLALICNKLFEVHECAFQLLPDGAARKSGQVMEGDILTAVLDLKKNPSIFGLKIFAQVFNLLILYFRGSVCHNRRSLKERNQ